MARHADVLSYIESDPLRDGLMAALSSGYRFIPPDAWQRLGMALVRQHHAQGDEAEAIEEQDHETPAEILYRFVFVYLHGKA